MLNFFLWYFTLTLLGWITFPLVYRLFPKFADRGYSFSRTLGLLVWSYAFWLLTSLGFSQNNLGGILLGLTVLVGASFGLQGTKENLKEVLNWVKTHLRTVATVEILFFLSFAALALLRATNPEALGTEKPMELAFINAIMRSPSFPPHDPWLSGYAISYYYFGYIMAAMLAKFTATAGSVAFNLMTSLVFALSALGAYGILYNLLSCALYPAAKETKTEKPPAPPSKQETLKRRRKPGFSIRSLPRPSHANDASQAALLGPLFLLLVSNFEALLELLHQQGLFWVANASNFWTWLNIKNLNADPATLEPIPQRFWWWWRASRVVQDFDLLGNRQEVIDEFPFFSFLLGDLHPHVLALPFALLAIAAAFYLFIGGWRGKTILFHFHIDLNPAALGGISLLLGGLAFLNTWDILPAATLTAAAYTLARVRRHGWSRERLEDFVYFGILSGIAAILLYLPFYLGFDSQAGGILPNLITPTRGAHLWVMFGTLLIPIFLWLFSLFPKKTMGRPPRRRRAQQAFDNEESQTFPDLKSGFGLVLGLLFALWVFSWLIAWAASALNADLVGALIRSQGVSSLGDLFRRATARRVEYLGGLFTLFLVAGGAVTWLFFDKKSKQGNQAEGHARHFVLLMILLGSVLVVAPEFFYLRDQFGTRMNTVFKFYYQAWLLWSLSAAYGSAVLLKKGRGIHQVGIAFLLAAALIYPVLGVISKQNPATPLSLDSAAYLHPDEAAAIAWLKSAPEGVLLEAVGGSYTGYARISTNSGLPALLGWPGHESQWRGGYDEMGTRQQDAERIYTSSDWELTRRLLAEYDVRYVIVGGLEKATYRVDERKFQRYLSPVFSQGDITIYFAPTLKP